MRFEAIKPVNPDRGQLKWIYFDNNRLWLDRENPKIDTTFLLLGDHVNSIELACQTREGSAIAFETSPRPTAPEGFNPFHDVPEEKRRLERMTFNFPEHGAVNILDAHSGRAIAQLQTYIRFPDFLFELYQRYENEFGSVGLPYFVETGILFGHTTLHASYWFDKVIAIELSDDLHRLAQSQLSGRGNIQFIQGNSAEVLPKVVAELDAAAMFFLDAHWSGDAGVDWNASDWSGYPIDTARLNPTNSAVTSQDQVPLMSELETIARSHRREAVVIIDDWAGVGQHDFAFKGQDWTHLNAAEILNWIQSHPRTRAHYPYDYKKYIWVLNEM